MFIIDFLIFFVLFIIYYLILDKFKLIKIARVRFIIGCTNDVVCQILCTLNVALKKVCMEYVDIFNKRALITTPLELCRNFMSMLSYGSPSFVRGYSILALSIFTYELYTYFHYKKLGINVTMKRMTCCPMWLQHDFCSIKSPALRSLQRQSHFLVISVTSWWELNDVQCSSAV